MKVLEFIENIAKSLGHFIDDLVTAWRRGDRRKVLLVGFVVLFLICASQQEWLRSIIPFLEKIPQLIQAPWLSILWTLVLLLFIGVIYESIKPPPPKPPPPTEFKESTAIKGLRSFTAKDQEIFKQLQRNQVLQECLAEINRDRFRFGILFGESGCGKTSFIQAGLIPQLDQADSDFQGIYVRFSEEDPLVPLRQAFVEKLPLIPEDLNHLDFLPLLAQGVEAADKPLVLIFDQFEQFFVHFKRKKDRQFFIQALANWYQNQQLPVKILVSIRKDFYAYLLEIQKAFGENYFLSPQEAIELEKFSPEEATNVIEVIARTTEGLTIDRAFTQEIAKQELASGEDGLISPVDVQLLAWIINGQKSAELRAFNEKAFQKLGGIEGLLTKFLERSLQTLITENQRQATMKVLRSLTDAERRVRAGILTFEEIQRKLPDIPVEILQQAINYLQADRVRLITPVERAGVIGYELAHEKMIPALLKLVDQELPEADKANQLLERRVNEWLSNNCEFYFLLRWRELQLINKQKPYLKWGINRQHKQKLIAASKRRFQRLFVRIIGFLVVLGLFWFGTKYYLATPRGEIQQVRWELNRLSEIVGNDRAASEIAVAMAKDSNLQRAQEIINSKIDDSSYKLEDLIALAKVYDELNQPEKGIKLLHNALITTTSYDETNLFPTRFSSYRSNKSKDLIAIVEAIGEFNQTELGFELLQDILTIYENSYLSDEIKFLSAIAKAYAKLNQPEQSIELLRQALTIAVEQIDDRGREISILKYIAEAIGELKQPEQSIELLQQALTIADNNKYLYNEVGVLNAIIETSAKLGKSKHSIGLLRNALKINNEVKNSQFQSYESYLMERIEIAKAYAKLNQSQEAISLLQQALTTANQIDDDSDILLIGGLSYKAYALRAIAEAIGELKSPEKGLELLQQAISFANQIDDSSSKASVLEAIAQAYAELGNWGEARRVSNQIPIQDEKAISLAQILNIWNEKKEISQKPNQ